MMKCLIVFLLFVVLDLFIHVWILEARVDALRADLRVLLDHEGLLKDTENQL